MPKIPQQVISLGILFLIAIGGFVIARKFFIPHSFGLYGHYRADAVEEIKKQEIVYAGAKACYDCHDDIYDLKAQSYHKDVACEVCHGPAASHVENPDGVLPPIPNDRKGCAICHDYSPPRPTGFPQIIEARHNPGKVCKSCHNPHNPTLPHTPESCSACHREIYMKKSISSHASLECATCHTVPEGHLTSPRANEVGKPQKREFCGQCHAEDAQVSKDILRIDLKTHGERSLCWECHYPHDPETNT
ncbi:MAG: hypothetical protein A3G33_10505 [Omnitrophica bacterium RIFCSPLOWO2_12_FULL_44_17]|uniref:Uncharacterized protein n=1 Tax=Candidatus Danuiimicrobium aquiferis TaxID=1801832 RepID=A0A1G1KR71_9BACT|nr:MAG: hypothetical protein A3B72_02820 [Omnitrophica bacterium RIFCSPHIGHO2_02_FULL_45_28]OGW88433.1 MAG: hypothetical protein A3E74_08180 [Omnitrophica bacterium RIFCSPHIGHO2_12_FULL_44_12]OGW95403.1 MAG: hypothetical protein A3G33_10505 [Omnitrophica bacterium RIFCSPLOWO2_12_FULL_44_17]OGX03285.1 MAG: hypothetical protein A3J12_07135 [Omnitrophica bacterium RIFCSPLOWO2_02_FULL_44_11]